MPWFNHHKVEQEFEVEFNVEHPQKNTNVKQLELINALKHFLPEHPDDCNVEHYEIVPKDLTENSPKIEVNPKIKIKPNFHVNPFFYQFDDFNVSDSYYSKSNPLITVNPINVNEVENTIEHNSNSKFTK